VTAVRKLVLAVDLGTSGPKAGVFDVEGRILGTGRRPVETLLLPDGGAEQDPEAVWRAVVDACREALAAPGSAQDVAAVSVCSQYSSIVPLDGHGKPTMNMILWLDKRAAKSALAALPGGRRVRDRPWRLLRWLRIHGIPPLDSGLDSLAHMRWVMLSRPDVYARTKLFLEPMDFIAYRLTGRATANACSAFLMLLVDNRDLLRARWHPTLLEYSALDPSKLPELVPVDAELGVVRPEVAEELGLPAGVKVHAPVNDTQAGGMGCFAHHGDHAGISIGSSSVLVTHVPFKRTAIGLSLVSMPSPVPGTYFVMAENGIGGRAAEYFLERLVFARDGFTDHSSTDGFAALERTASAVEPGSGGVLFLPWLGGSLSPAEDARVRGGFLNMSLETTRAQLGRAVLEGVALNLRWLRGAVERFARRRLARFVLGGGGAGSDLWAQIVADVVGLPVHQVADPRFSTCRGAALLGLHRLGLVGIDDFERRVPIRAVREPRAELAPRYDLLFEQFARAFHANRRIFRALNPDRTPAPPAKTGE
jgi:xylulokinase